VAIKYLIKKRNQDKKKKKEEKGKSTAQFYINIDLQECLLSQTFQNKTFMSPIDYIL